MVNKLDEEKHRGALKSKRQIKKILADHYNAEKPSPKDESYYDYAARM